ncbi:MAG: PH domain-containing protein [Gammaproteobacteria bacterium]|nr:PH domain-containing protein [Gammaproteobacteria bacterium]
MIDGSWQRTSPFSVVFFFGRAIKQLAGGAMQMAASAGAVVVALQSDNVGWALLAAVVVLALLLATAILRYWFFRFAVDDEGLRIRQGVFKKTHLEIQFDRVQGMDVERSLVDRWLGLATVTFDTAGSAAREGQLPAIPRTFADTLRQRIEQQGRSVAPEGADDEAPPPLLRLGAGDMVRIGVTDRSVLVGLAVLPVLFQAYGEVAEEFATRAATAASEELLALGLWFGVLVVLVLIVAAIAGLALLTVASAFLRFHDFELRHDGSAFRSRAGLLTRKEVVVERAKIQQVSVAQGVIMVLMRRCRVKMLPATSGAASEGVPVGGQTLNVPLVDVPRLVDLGARVFGEEGKRLGLCPDDDAFRAISPVYIRARVLAVGILPALVGAAVLVPIFGAIGLLVLIWPVPVLLAAWQAWRRRGYLVDDDGLASRHGLFGYALDAFLFRKAQGATVSRSPLQRRKGLASLTVHLASGDVTVPYMDFATASRLRDYLLFKVESSQRPWH